VRSSQLRRRHKRSVLGSLVLLTVLFLTLAVAGGAVYWFVVQKWTVQDLQRLITLGKLPNAGPQEPGPGPERPAPLPPSPPSP
jgi:hypothetical protein